MSQYIAQANDSITHSQYKIYSGDCLNILKKLPKKSVNLIFADPPYNLQLKKTLYRPNQTKVNGVADDWDKFTSNAEYDKFTIDWLNACRNIMRDDATIWVIGSYHNIFRVGKIMMDLGFWILNDVQWYKPNPMPNFRGVRFTNATETLIWAKKLESQKKYTFNHQTMKGLNEGKQMTSVWKIPLCTGSERIKDKDGKKAHSTQKPEELLKRVILACSNEGDVVLDPFSGSGTTCAMAKKLNRRCIGIEKDKKYVQISKKRLNDINPDDFQHLRISEIKKTALTRVSMAQLLAANYLQPSQTLYTKNKKHSATVLADGTIKHHQHKGSIHQIGAIIKKTPNCNGWVFWYYDNNGQLTLIDHCRQTYRKQHNINTDAP